HCFFYLLTRPPPSSTLFPYTTLFRSIRLPRQRSATGRIHRPNYPCRGEIRFGDGEGAVARDEGPTASARFRAGRPHAHGLPGKRRQAGADVRRGQTRAPAPGAAGRLIRYRGGIPASRREKGRRERLYTAHSTR